MADIETTIQSTIDPLVFRLTSTFDIQPGDEPVLMMRNMSGLPGLSHFMATPEGHSDTIVSRLTGGNPRWDCPPERIQEIRIDRRAITVRCAGLGEARRLLQAIDLELCMWESDNRQLAETERLHP